MPLDQPDHQYGVSECEKSFRAPVEGIDLHEFRVAATQSHNRRPDRHQHEEQGEPEAPESQRRQCVALSQPVQKQQVGRQGVSWATS